MMLILDLTVVLLLVAQSSSFKAQFIQLNTRGHLWLGIDS